jgi:hypothetical protein
MVGARVRRQMIGPAGQRAQFFSAEARTLILNAVDKLDAVDLETGPSGTIC